MQKMENESIEKRLTGNELLDYMEHNGIVHELNRTFLHPLGLDCRLNIDSKEIEIWQTEDDKGFLMDRLNPMHISIFQKLSIRKHTTRNNQIGFGIQTKDTYRPEQLKKIADTIISPERSKIELIMTCLSIFSHYVYTKIVKKHHDYDQYLEPLQFSKAVLLEKLYQNEKEEDWIDVAATAMMLDQRKKLQEGMKEIKEQSVKYFEKVKEAKEKQKRLIDKDIPGPVESN